MDANKESVAMTEPEEHRPDDQGDQGLRLTILEYQIRALLSAVAELAGAVEVMAFVSANPHAAVVLGRVRRTLAEVGVQIPPGLASVRKGSA
jgi:hypothetical protein